MTIPGPIQRATVDGNEEVECLLQCGNIALTRCGIHGSYEIVHIPTGYGMCRYNFFTKDLLLAIDLIYEYSKHNWAFTDPNTIPDDTKKFMDKIIKIKKYAVFFKLLYTW